MWTDFDYVGGPIRRKGTRDVRVYVGRWSYPKGFVTRPVSVGTNFGGTERYTSFRTRTEFEGRVGEYVRREGPRGPRRDLKGKKSVCESTV